MTSPQSGEPAPVPAILAPGLEARVEKEAPVEWTLAHFDTRLPDLPLYYY